MRFKRSAFFVFAASSFIGLHLAGCGSGSGPDSAYQGAYRSVYSITTLGETGSFTFSIEQKRRMTGSLLDTNTNKSYPFDGSIGTNGSFRGNVKDGVTQYPLSGTFSPGAQAGGIAGGDFKQTRNQVDYIAAALRSPLMPRN